MASQTHVTKVDEFSPTQHRARCLCGWTSDVFQDAAKAVTAADVHRMNAKVQAL